MKAHVYWMQGWRNAPPRAVRNVKAWMDAGFDVVRWDDTNERAVLPPAYKWPEGVAPAMRCDVVLASAQARFGGLALGADMRPIRPQRIKNFAAMLEEWKPGVGFVVWQNRTDHPYNGGSWFPAGNEWIALVAAEHRRTLCDLRRVLASESPDKMTGPRKWKELIGCNKLLWRDQVEVLPGHKVFLYEPRHRDLISKEAWLDAGFTGDWNGTKTGAWD